MYEVEPQPSRHSHAATELYDDPDYDVYLFWPSSRPYIVLPAESFDPFELRSVPEWLQDGQLYRAPTSSSLPLSPTYSFVSDFESPSSAARDVGYSNFFSSGLFSTSRRMTRSFDDILRKIRQGLQATRRLFV